MECVPLTKHSFSETKRWKFSFFMYISNPTKQNSYSSVTHFVGVTQNKDIET